MIITLTLNPSVDYVMEVPELYAEDTLRAKDVFFMAGGKGINVSRVLSCLGVATEAWGFCGGDTGQWLMDFLDNQQVPHRFTITQNKTRINTILTELSTQKQIRVSAAGETVSSQEIEALLSQLDQLSSQVAWLSIGGSLPPNLTADHIKAIIATANAKGIRCFLDADGAALQKGLEASPYCIKPNQYELERLVGKTCVSHNEIIAESQSLIAEGKVSVVFVSLAAEGALMISQDEVFFGKAPAVQVNSKVGAGDSMVAGLIKGFWENQSHSEILRSGIASGTAAVMTKSYELCQPTVFQQLLPQINIETL